MHHESDNITNLPRTSETAMTGSSPLEHNIIDPLENVKENIESSLVRGAKKAERIQKIDSNKTRKKIRESIGVNGWKDKIAAHDKINEMIEKKSSGIYTPEEMQRDIQELINMSKDGKVADLKEVSDILNGHNEN